MDKKHVECSGPCEQGRLNCPTPWACEREEPQNDKWYYLPEFIVAVALVVILLFSWLVSR